MKCLSDHISSEPIMLGSDLISGWRCGNGIIMLRVISFVAVQISMPTEPTRKAPFISGQYILNVLVYDSWERSNVCPQPQLKCCILCIQVVSKPKEDFYFLFVLLNFF